MMRFMCTLVLLRRPHHAWPLILAANRDEVAGRPWRPPARHWQDHADVTAGLDELADGTWLGISDRGLISAVLNRPGTLGPEAHKRSRGELPLAALDYESADAAMEALTHLNPDAYRPFNLLVADAHQAFLLTHEADTNRISSAPIPDGLHMITAHGLDHADQSARVAHYRPLFAAAAPPEPDSGNWQAWESLIACTDPAPGGGPHNAPHSAMCLNDADGFGTRSSSFIALAKPQQPPRLPIWRFCHGPPTTERWSDIALLA